MQSVHQYNNNHFPCFISFGEDTERFENAAGRNIATNPRSLYRIEARNALRNLTYGKPLAINLWQSFKALFIKKDPELLKALRIEMKQLFTNAYKKIHLFDPNDGQAQMRFEVFINTLIANYPFMDPEENEKVTIPQKINNEWHAVSYQFKKIDISPSSGLIAQLMEEEDKVYAYGMKPLLNDKAHPYLLLMGTTYPSGQGSVLSIMSDLTPGISVGESHLLSPLAEWMGTLQKKVVIAGHSQGGSMAQIMAATYPQYTEKVYALNPTALHKKTLARLNARLRDAKQQEHIPSIFVFKNKNDPVFKFGDGFLNSTMIYSIDHPTADKCSALAAHAQHFSGHKRATIKKITDIPAQRHFANDLKYFVDRMIYPLLSTGLIYSLCKRKIVQTAAKNNSLLMVLVFGITLTIYAALIATGVLNLAGIAMTISFLKTAAPMVAYTAISIGLIACTALSTYLLPPFMLLALRTTELALCIVTAALVSIGIIASAILCCFNAMRRYLFEKNDLANPLQQDILSSTANSQQLLLSTSPKTIKRVRLQQAYAKDDIHIKVSCSSHQIFHTCESKNAALSSQSLVSQQLIFQSPNFVN